MRTRHVGRRDFLKTSAGAALSAGLFASGLRAAESTAASNKLNIACIGTANRAAADINGVQHENIVALVDVDSNYLDAAKKGFPSARGYVDYREMLEQEAGKIDAVVVGTTDHHHAPATIRAIRKKLHVYCEKPLTHTVQEARLIAQAAKEMGVATQMGTQIHASDNYRRVVEIVQAGTLGDITQVHVWVGKGWGVQDWPVSSTEVPANLNWDLWLGPAPIREFHAGRYHPAQWRRWWDFGQGTLGDMGCHYMDLPFWALGLRHPIKVTAEGPEVNDQMAPVGLTVHYDFPSPGSKPPVKLTWYDGQNIPKTIEGQPVPASGVMFVGSEGMMFASYTNYKLFPQEKFANFTPPPQTIEKSIGHHNEWIRACKEGTPTLCNFDYAGALTETVLLGNVAYRVGQPLDWDASALKATNAPAADKLLRKEYRSGWEVV
ncbi:MAG: Gfo/Idh/MocA family protein [Planctomycetaceae bacterium]